MQIIKQVKMHNTTEGHSKVWKGILYSNGTVMTEWGRLDQEFLQSKGFPNVGADFLEKKIEEKERKGYEIV